MERTELFVKQGSFSCCLGHSDPHRWAEPLSFPSIFPFKRGEVDGCSLGASPGPVVLDQRSVEHCLDERPIKLLISTAD